MTGQPSSRRPDVDRDPGLAAVERRLEQRVTADPPAALRHRVVMAVDHVLATPLPIPRPDDGFIPAWSWAAATALGLALAVPVVAGVDAMCRSAGPALAARWRIAGVADSSLMASFADTPRVDDAGVPLRPARDSATRRPASRLIELERLIEEML